jgi:antitoxin component YwqK of YwqJK toxin-antitoxin module
MRVIFTLGKCCVLLIIFAHEPSLAAVRVCELNGKSVSPDNGSTTSGMTGIMRCTDRDTKELLREQEIQNGAFFGIERFYEKGKLQRDYRTNAKGNREGQSKTYADGVLIANEVYEAGSNVGLQKYYFASGALKALNFYTVTKAASADSPFIQTQESASIALNENGTLRDIRCAKKPEIDFEKISDQKLCGFSGVSELEFFSRTRLDSRRTYLRGEVIATVTFWENGKTRLSSATKDGKTIENRFNQSEQKLREIHYQDVNATNGLRRIKTLEKEFHESGVLVSESHWSEGLITQEKVWYLNGQPKTQLDYKGTAYTRNDFHDNGIRSFRGNFIRLRSSSQATGDHQYFDEQGRVRLVQAYNEKTQLVREQVLDESGVITRDDALLEDGSRKAYAK